MIPTFAVVGHPNKGKSSIVATLAEDERLAIGPTPGTTRRAAPHTFSIDGQPQYVLVDTPGFQRAGAVLEWLEARATTASARAQAGVGDPAPDFTKLGNDGITYTLSDAFGQQVQLIYFIGYS